MKRRIDPDIDAQLAAALVPLLRAVRAHRWVVIAITIAAMLACGAFLLQRTSIYEAHSEIVITPLTEGETAFVGLPILRTSPGDPTRTVTTAAALITSSATAGSAAKQLPGWTASRVREAVDVEPIEGTNVVQITAQADSPDEAAAVASAYATGAIEAQRQILKPAVREKIESTKGQLSLQKSQDAATITADLRSQLSQLRSIRDGTDPTMSVSSLAEPPGTSLGRPWWLLLLVAAAGGLLLGAGTALLLNLVSPAKIEDAGDLLSILSLPILARVPAPHRMRALSASERTEVRDGMRLLMARIRLTLGDRPARSSHADSPASLIVLVTVGSAATGAAASLELTRVIAEIGETTILPGDVTRNVVREARRSTDEVIVDSSSSRDLPAILELLPETDQVVVVVRYRATTSDDLAEVAEALDQAGATYRAGYLILGAPSSYVAGKELGGWLVHADEDSPDPDRAHPASPSEGSPASRG